MKALAPEIVESVRSMAPANTMFSKGVRLAGIMAMARLHIAEGIRLTLMMQLKEWGRDYIVGESLDVLKQDRGSAKSILPELKKMEADFSKKDKNRDKLHEVIAMIEKDDNPPKLVSLGDHLKNKP